MKCNQHKKELEFKCTWCGKDICELCIAKKEGLKIFCHNCMNTLGKITPAKIRAKTEQKPQEKPRIKDLQIDDGYIVLPGGEK